MNLNQFYKYCGALPLSFRGSRERQVQSTKIFVETGYS